MAEVNGANSWFKYLVEADKLNKEKAIILREQLLAQMRIRQIQDLLNGSANDNEPKLK